MGAGKTLLQAQTTSAASPRSGSHQQPCRHCDFEGCKDFSDLVQKDYFGQSKHK